ARRLGHRDRHGSRQDGAGRRDLCGPSCPRGARRRLQTGRHRGRRARAGHPPRPRAARCVHGPASRGGQPAHVRPGRLTPSRGRRRAAGAREAGGRGARRGSRGRRARRRGSRRAARPVRRAGLRRARARPRARAAGRDRRASRPGHDQSRAADDRGGVFGGPRRAGSGAHTVARRTLRDGALECGDDRVARRRHGQPPPARGGADARRTGAGGSRAARRPLDRCGDSTGL
ncbi:MAG: Dethiobiotin synthetase, partial [uncultured Solirubrobacteraceae bacterium]